MIRYGEIKVLNVNGLENVEGAYFGLIPTGTIRTDNGHEIVTRVKTSRGKMVCKNYGILRKDDYPFDKARVKRIVFKPEEIIIVI